MIGRYLQMPWLFVPVLMGMHLVTLSLTTPTAAAQTPSVVEVTIFDDGAPGATGSVDVSIDTTRGNCETDPTAAADPEPFFDTVVALTISNPSYANLRVSSVRYETTRIGPKRRFTSPKIAPIGPLEVKAGEQSAIYIPILTGHNGTKVFPKGDLSTASVVGLRTLSFTIVGTLNNRLVTLRARSTVSFGDFNRCD